MNPGSLRARAQFFGRFVSSNVVTGTFRGHSVYYKANGSLLATCDTGAVACTAKH